MADGREETLKIPDAVRRQIDEGRDHGYCRFCGKLLLQRRALHHIRYGGSAGGMGGRRDHAPANLISLCYLPGDNGCHQRVHSNKQFYQSLLLELTEGSHPHHVTVLQLMRWKGLRHGRDREVM